MKLQQHLQDYQLSQKEINHGYDIQELTDVDEKSNKHNDLKQKAKQTIWSSCEILSSSLGKLTSISFYHVHGSK